MALGFTGGSGNGEIMPYVKYNAKSGRLMRIDRVEDANGAWSTVEENITSIAQMAMDFANIRVGWIYFSNEGPKKVFVKPGEAFAPRPEGKDKEGRPLYKQGFEITLVLDAASGGGGPRIFSSNAASVCDAMNVLHDAYLAAPESKADKIPVVKITGDTLIKSGKGEAYKPTFSIVSWIARPATLQVAAAASSAASAPATSGLVVTPAPTTAVAPPSTGSTVVAPPAPHVDLMVAPPAPVAPAGAGDFG